jgi:hypothetical protein
MEGDALNVTVSATFVGEEATNIIAYENENLTAKPVYGKALLDAEISSLESSLFFSAEITHSSLEKAALLESNANAITGAGEAQVSLPEIQPLIYIESQGSMEEAEFMALQQFFSDLNGQASITNSPLSGKISFEETIHAEAFIEKKGLIEGRLGELGIGAIVTEETGTLSGQLNFESSASSAVASKLSKLLEEISLQYEIFQPGTVLAEEIYDSTLNASYPVPNSEMQALLLPGHAIGSIAKVEAEYEIVRESISTAFATELK